MDLALNLDLDPQLTSRQSQRLLQLGVALLLFTSFEGFVVENLPSPTLGRSVHTLSGITAILLMAFGLAWTRLSLGVATSRLAFWFLVYSSLAIIVAFVMAALWNAGNTVMPIAAGSAHGTAAQELAIMIVAYSSAPTGIIAFALVLWGLRKLPR